MGAAVAQMTDYASDYSSDEEFLDDWRDDWRAQKAGLIPFQGGYVKESNLPGAPFSLDRTQLPEISIASLTKSLSESNLAGLGKGTTGTQLGEFRRRETAVDDIPSIEL